MQNAAIRIIVAAVALASGAALAQVPKSQRTPAEAKVDARLLLPPGGPGRTVAAEDVFVVVQATVTPDLVDGLRALGARDIEAFPAYDTVHAVVPAQAVTLVAERPDVRSVGPRVPFRTQRYIPKPDDPPSPYPDNMIPKVGTVNWQGVTAHQADKVHATGFNGAGTMLCVLSDGVDTLPTRVGTGNLPAGITVLAAGSGDEGTAMLELAYDMAPGATLGFATAGNSPAQFAQNIVSLRNAGCDVIVDDVIFLNEPAFQDGVVAQAVNQVTAAGALYFSAAGNYGSVSRGTSGTYEADFSPSGATVPAAITQAEGQAVVAHNFNGLPYTTLTAATDIVSLQWAERAGGATSDYDLFVMDSTGTTILGAGSNNQNGTQDAVEFAQCSGTNCFFPSGSRVYVVRYSGVPRPIRLSTFGGRLSNNTASSIFGHMATSGAIAVAAVDVRSVGNNSFGISNQITTYSSDGPRRFFLLPNGNEVTPNNRTFAGNGGVQVAKVDIAASDCGATSTTGFTTFCGTSAAAPTAAAIAALLRSASPTATPAQIKSRMLASAVDIMGAGIDRDSGAGIPIAARGVAAGLSNIMVAKDFTPALAQANTPIRLRVRLNNPNAVAISGVAFGDTLPASLIIANTPNVQASPASCTGTLVANPAATTFSLVGGRIPANTVCSYSVDVTTSVNGSYTDASGPVTTPIGLDSPAISAKVDVGTVPGAPTLLQSIPGNGFITFRIGLPSNTGGLPLLSMSVTCNPTGAGSATTVAINSVMTEFSVPVANGASYTCTVSVLNAIGSSPPSLPSSPVAPQKGDQPITFLSVAPAPAVPNGPAYTPVFDTNGPAPALAVDGASAGICAISNRSVTFQAVGTCTVIATRAGDAFFNPAQASQTMTVAVPTGLVAFPPSIAFAPQSMGTSSAPIAVTIGNYTGSAITVSGIASNPVVSAFSVTHDCTTLAPNATCTMQVVFAPATGTGPLNGTRQESTGIVVANSGTGLAVNFSGTAEKSLVRHYYRSILGREPDAGGKAFWDGEAQRIVDLGPSLRETLYVMAGYFFNSAEYQAANKTDVAYVQDLYRTFFNRSADAGGLNFWTGQIAGGLPRDVVLFSFMFSPEFKSFVEAIFGTSTPRAEVDMVVDFFRGLLNRLPDSSSYAYWLGRLRTAQCGGASAVATEVDAISAAFMLSPEYGQRLRNGTQIVTDMYYSFLRRGGDAAGVQFWVGELNAGRMTANQVRLAFIKTPEFNARVQAVAAAGCLP